MTNTNITVEQALDLIFTLGEVEVIILDTGLEKTYDDLYEVMESDYAETYKKAIVSSIKIRGNTVTILAKYYNS